MLWQTQKGFRSAVSQSCTVKKPSTLPEMGLVDGVVAAIEPPVLLYSDSLCHTPRIVPLMELFCCPSACFLNTVISSPPFLPCYLWSGNSLPPPTYRGRSHGWFPRAARFIPDFLLLSNNSHLLPEDCSSCRTEYVIPLKCSGIPVQSCHADLLLEER